MPNRSNFWQHTYAIAPGFATARYTTLKERQALEGKELRKSCSKHAECNWKIIHFHLSFFNYYTLYFLKIFLYTIKHLKLFLNILDIKVKISSLRPWRTTGDVDARVHIYTTMALGRGRVASLVSCLYSQGRPRYSFYWRLSGLQDHSRIQTGPGVHSASYKMSTGGFPWE